MPKNNRKSAAAKTKSRQTAFPKNLLSLIPMLSALPFAVSLTDAGNNYLYVNKAFERKYGHTLASLQGRDHAILWPRRTPASVAFLKNLKTVTRNGGWNGQLINITRKGKLLHIGLRTLPIFSPSGESRKSMPTSATPSRVLHLGIACDAGDEDKRDRVMLKVLFGHLIAQATRLAKSDATAESTLLARQPKRRQQIYRLMREGLSYKDIAFTLKISNVTVRVVASDLRKQLGEDLVPRLRKDRVNKPNSPAPG